MKNKKGFTLAELLVVIAIIAVLAGISIPVFTAQTKKANQAVDVANVRAAYAEAMGDALLTKTAVTKTVAVKEAYDGTSIASVAGISWGTDDTVTVSVTADGVATIKGTKTK